MKLVEFLYFYLMPETAPPPKVPTSATNTAILGGRGRELAAAFADHRRRETITVQANGSGEQDGNTRSTEDKQNMLSKYLNNVQDLVEDLKEGGGPFGVGS